jgi:hypothetical protein
MRGSSFALVLTLLSVLSGCVAVHPWQREKLASRAMADPFAESELSSQYDAKVLESKTGGGLPGTSPGGGCGCTQ